MNGLDFWAQEPPPMGVETLGHGFPGRRPVLNPGSRNVEMVQVQLPFPKASTSPNHQPKPPAY